MSGTISNEQALIYVMVMMSGVEGTIKPEELAEIDILVRTLPVFKNFDRTRLATVAQEAGDMLQVSEGMQTVLDLVAINCHRVCVKQPMRLPLKWQPSIWQWAKKNCASLRFCGMRWAWINW